MNIRKYDRSEYSSGATCTSRHHRNAGTLVVFRVGAEDAALLAPEFAVGTLDAGLVLSPENRPVVAGDLTSQEPFTVWMRRGLERDHVLVEPKGFQQHGAAPLIREQSRQRFGRSRAAIERQRRMRFGQN